MQTIGRYRVIRPLGAGGMGQVFLARDPELDRDVALKLLHGDAAARGAKRAQFRAEARSVAALRHPGIVTIYEIGEQGDQQFIAMEYLPGRSMRTLMDTGDDVSVLLRICQRVAEAVAAAHAQGILHRDIKPENVVVCEDDTVKVVDFGLARRLDTPEETAKSERPRAAAMVDAFTQTLAAEGPATIESAPAATNTVFGTPAYMAPEVLQGEPSSQASDAWALGVMLYECIAGRRPVQASTLYELIARIIDGEPVAPLEHALWELIARLLDHDPANRPGLDEVANELGEYVMRTPVISLRPSAPSRPAEVDATTATVPTTPKRARWPWIAVGGAVVAVVVVMVIAGSRKAPAHAIEPPAVSPKRIAIAVQDLDMSIPSYGTNDALSSGEYAQVVSALLRQIEGSGVLDLERFRLKPHDWVAVARKENATHLLRGSIREQDRLLHAEVEVLDLAAPSTPRTLDIKSRQPAELGEMMVEIANRTMEAAGSPARLVDRVSRAESFYVKGRKLYEGADWRGAVPWAEVAVTLDPNAFDGWLTLALVRGWMLSSPELGEEALRRAFTLKKTNSGPRAAMIDGVIAYLDGRYNEAISLLSPLQSDPAMSENERMDVLYYLGEAYWHDGQHAKGYELLRTARLRPAPNPTSPKLAFKPAIIHCAEYAVGRRLPEASAYAVSLDDPRVESVMFANRQYKDLADDRNALFHYYAMLVLDRPTTPAEDPSVPSDRHLWRAAHQAALGRFAPASAELDEVWKTFESTPNGANFYSAEILGEIVLSTTGLSDQLAKFFAFHRTWSAKHPHRYLRFAILAAPLTGDPLPPRTGMTTRERMLADAIEAELRGDRKTAADVLEQVVLDPGTFWEFPERVALLRNLIALGDQARIEKVCDEISHPAMIRAAFEPARAACRAYKNRRSR